VFSVVVSSITRFWAFSLAEQLQKRGLLGQLLVSWFNPETIARGYNIDPALVTKNIVPFVVDRLPWKIPGLAFSGMFCQQSACRLFDRWACGRLRPCDIFAGWSSFSLRTLERARELGAVCIVEHGSSHPLVQAEILSDEAEAYGLSVPPVNPYVIDRMLGEFELADRIAIPSRFVERTFLSEGVPAEKLLRVPYGVNLGMFKQIPKRDDVFRIMHIGGSIRKGTHYLVRALTELALPNSELVLIGTPDSVVSGFLEKYSGRLTHLRGVPQAELFRHYSQSSVYVLPSIEEGLAMVQAEAMACGCPVVCSTNTGGEDIIRDGVDGFVVPVRDVDALKQRIELLYRDEERRRAMAESGKERVREFTWDHYGDRVVENYRSLLKM
jgi:glycosyltransferase involved in cell wall biosynthesis